MIDRQAVLQRIATRIQDAAEEAEIASEECSQPPHRPVRRLPRPAADNVLLLGERRRATQRNE